MQSKLAALFFFAILFVQGCIPSLHPLYQAEDVVLHKSLKQHSYQNDNSEWHFQKIPGKKTYHLSYMEDGASAQFEVHLVKLGTHLFFDFFPIKNQASPKQQKVNNQASSENAFFDMHLMPVHSFAKVDFTEEGIIIKQFDSDWLEKLFRERRIRIKHEITDRGIVLTASTKELQKFILKYAEEEQVYMEAVLLKPKA